MQRQFANIMFFGLVLFGAIFVFTLFWLEPSQGVSSVIAFYASFTLVVACFFSLLSFVARKKLSNNELYFANIKVSFRQSFLLAIFLDLTLFIASINLLTWWDITLLALSLVLLELYFESNKVKAVDNHPAIR